MLRWLNLGRTGSYKVHSLRLYCRYKSDVDNADPNISPSSQVVHKLIQSRRHGWEQLKSAHSQEPRTTLIMHHLSEVTSRGTPNTSQQPLLAVNCYKHFLSSARLSRENIRTVRKMKLVCNKKPAVWIMPVMFQWEIFILRRPQPEEGRKKLMSTFVSKKNLLSIGFGSR